MYMYVHSYIICMCVCMAYARFFEFHPVNTVASTLPHSYQSSDLMGDVPGHRQQGQALVEAVVYVADIAVALGVDGPDVAVVHSGPVSLCEVVVSPHQDVGYGGLTVQLVYHALISD